MSDEVSAILRRLDATERNQTDHAKSMSVVIADQQDLREKITALELREAVNVEREKSRDDWRIRTEKRLDGIYKLGWWVLGTFGSLVILQLSRLLFPGGVGGP